MHKFTYRSTSVIEEILFSFLLLELMLGGGGRIFSFGFFSFRMVLFAVAFFWSLFKFYNFKIYENFYILFFYFLVSLLIASLLGFINGAPKSLIFEDIKPLSYFLSLFFFSIYINSYERVLKVVHLIKVSSFLLAFVYLILQFLLHTKLISFVHFYTVLSNPNFANEFMFRGNEGFFFYKGFITLCTGFFFYAFSQKKSDKFIALFIFSAIYFTFVRGFLLTIFLSFIIYSIISFDGKALKGSVSLSIVLILISIFSFGYFITKLGNRDVSDSKRIIQISQVISDTDLGSLFVGHGFGMGVPVRPVHMEISFLEIFHKQGLLGLFFWLFLLVLAIKNFLFLQTTVYKSIAIPFFLSIVVIYTQSLTNPYLNNPIGMSIVLIAICVLRTLAIEGHRNSI